MSQETLNTSLQAATPSSPPAVESSVATGNGRTRRWFPPSLDSILFNAIFLGVLILGQQQVLGTDGDTPLHLRLGNDILTHGGLVTTNTLTSAGYGQPFIAWEWLSELLFAGAWRLLGLNGVVAVVSIIVALTSLLLFRAVRRRGVPMLLALPLTLIAIALTSIHWLARPHIFSLLLTLWWSEQLWAYWQSGNPHKLWPLPLVMALWANLHGGYVVGLIILGTATSLVWFFPNAASTRNVDARRWQLTRALVACLLATLLTPWGLAGPLHITSFLSNGTALSNIQEYNSPDFHQPYGQIFLFLLLLLGACGVLRGWLAGGRAIRPANLEAQDDQHILAQLATREPGALGWALVGIFTAMALYSVRALPLWALVVTPILGRELTSWSAEWAASGTSGHFAHFCRALFLRSRRLDALHKGLRSGLLVSLTSMFILILLLNQGRLPGTPAQLLNAQFSPSTFPIEAVQAIQQGGIPGGALPAGTGFTAITWAGYVELTLPHRVLMVDARVDFFDPSVLNDYQTLINGEPGWDQIIQDYQIHWLLIPPTVPLAQIISLTHEWTCQDINNHHSALLCIPVPTVPVA
jgi:hypothetical protein